MGMGVGRPVAVPLALPEAPTFSQERSTTFSPERSGR